VWVCALHMSVMWMGAARRLLLARFLVGCSLYVMRVYMNGRGNVLLPPYYWSLVLLVIGMALP
jgi:hypothetical protein